MCFYLSDISLAILPEDSRLTLFELLSNTRKNGSKIIFDNNYRPALWTSIDAEKNHTIQCFL